jgi:predicted membrane-bound spermidine synthase
MRNAKLVVTAYAGLLTLSGFAGLSYEVVWLRSLSNTLGSSMVATSTILATFMAGMALGSLVVGRRADGLRRPLVGYAVLELCLAACAVAVPRMLGLVAGIDSIASAAHLPALLAKAIAAAVVLLVPTFVMGGTLPIVAADIGRRFRQPGAVFTACYAVHVLGAASGALVASFILIARFGLSMTSTLGAVVNVTVALGALLLARYTYPEVGAGTTKGAQRKGSARSSLRAWPWMATALLSGFIILGCEVVFVRILVLSLMAKVHSFAIMLAVFLVALSIGSFVASRLPRHWIRHPLTLSVILLLGALGLLLSREIPLHWPLPFLMSAQQWGSIGADELAAAAVPSGLLAAVVNTQADIQTAEYLKIALLISTLALFPFVIPLGMVLPIVMRRVAFESEARGGWTGRILFWNTVGSVLGPLVAPYLLVPRLSLEGTLWAMSLLVAAFGAAWGCSALWRERRAIRWLWLPIAAGFAVWFATTNSRLDGTPELDCTREGAARLFGDGRVPRVLHHEEGASCTVSVVQTAQGKRILRLDGFEAAATMDAKMLDYLYMRLMAHLPALLFGDAPIEKSLVICCGTGGTAGAMTVHTRQRVDLVDLHPEVLACLPWFDEWNHGVARNPRCRTIAADGRAHIRALEDEYDIITLEPMPPQFAGMTQLYSVEFYEGCRDALRQGGLVCQWLPLHLVTREQALAMMRAMSEVFPTVQYWEHAGNGMLVGTMRPELPLTVSIVDRLRANPLLQQDLEQGGLLGVADLAAGFICDSRDMGEEFGQAQPTRDDRPALEYATVSHGLRYPSAAELAHRREPFYTAALQAELPLAGFDGMDELRGFVLARNFERYARMLAELGQVEQAREFLRRQIEVHPELPTIAQLRGLLEQETTEP